MKKEISEKEQYLNKIKQDISSRENISKNSKDQEISKMKEEISFRDKQIDILKKEVNEKNTKNNHKILFPPKNLYAILCSYILCRFLYL